MTQKSEEEYLAELVKFQTVTGDFDEAKKCAEYCSDFFRSHGLYSEIIESEGFPNVFATTQKTKKPKVLLQAHMDVVPAKQELFRLAEKDGKLYGRGVLDMKFAGASYMTLIDKMENSLDQYDFGVFFSFDEEVGGSNGVEAMLKKGYSADVCILPDAGSDWCLKSTAHGAWWMSIKAAGKTAHASMPYKGINAAQELVRAVEQIINTEWGYNKSELSVSLTVLNSGSAVNQIPDEAEAKFDIRFKNPAIYNDIKKKIENICAKENLKVSTLEYVVPTDIKDCLEIQNFVKITEEIIERKTTIGHGAGATDGRYFSEHNIPTVIIQPLGGDQHSENEWIDHAGLKQFTQILHEYILQTAKI